MSAPERDEDELFEGYMRQHFPGAVADRVPALAGSERGSTARSDEQGQPSEDELVEAYMRQHFPRALH